MRRPIRDGLSFAGAQAEFAALPTELRVLLAPGLVDRLVAAGHPAEARLIYDTAIRPGQAADAALDLAAARLAAAEGRPLEAAQGLGALVETGGQTPVEAVIDLVRLALDAGLPIPDRIVTDLRAGALQYRGSDREPVLRGLLAEALASRAELPEAIREVRAAMRDLPGEGPAFAALGVALIAGADPAAVGAAAYAETVLTTPDLIGGIAADDPRRAIIAARMVEIGLPEPALGLVAPAASAGSVGARLVAARGELSRGRPEAARAALGPVEGAEAATLRARSFALAGAFDQALATLAERGMAEAASSYAWPSGDWSRARAAAAEDPARLAMASYMTVRSRRGRGPCPVARPGRPGGRGRVPGAAAAARRAEPRRRAPASRHRGQGRWLRRGRPRRAVERRLSPRRAGAAGAPSRPTSSGRDSAATRSSSEARLWQARKLSTCGRIARTPRARGVKPSQRRSGFSQISRRAESCSRSISAASRAGSSRSRPSVINSTTAPWLSTRRDQSRLKACRQAPMRVPPSQSCASRPAAASAASTSRRRRWRVMLVSRVPKVKACTCAQPAPFALAAACRKWSSIRE